MSRRKSLGGTCTICGRVNKNIGCSKKLLFWEIVIISKMETKPLCFIYLEIKITISLKSLKYICFLLLRAKKWYFYHYFLGVCESWLEWLFTKRKQKRVNKKLKRILCLSNNRCEVLEILCTKTITKFKNIHLRENLYCTIRAVWFGALKIVSSAKHLVESLLHKSKSRYA